MNCPELCYGRFKKAPGDPARVILWPTPGRGQYVRGIKSPFSKQTAGVCKRREGRWWPPNTSSLLRGFVDGQLCGSAIARGGEGRWGGGRGRPPSLPLSPRCESRIRDKHHYSCHGPLDPQRRAGSGLGVRGWSCITSGEVKTQRFWVFSSGVPSILENKLKPPQDFPPDFREPWGRGCKLCRGSLLPLGRTIWQNWTAKCINLADLQSPGRFPKCIPCMQSNHKPRAVLSTPRKRQREGRHVLKALGIPLQCSTAAVRRRDSPGGGGGGQSEIPRSPPSRRRAEGSSAGGLGRGGGAERIAMSYVCCEQNIFSLHSETVAELIKAQQAVKSFAN